MQKQSKKKKLVVGAQNKLAPLTTDQLETVNGGGDGVPTVIEGLMRGLSR